MDCLHDFDKDLDWVLTSYKNKISSYSPVFRQGALNFWEKYNALHDDKKKNYICYLLPFWLWQTFQFDRDDCRKISLGNIFGYFYFLVQDAVMDTAPGEYHGDLLPLGNLFFLDFIGQYRELFTSDSPFWSYLTKYFNVWADGVAWEREEHWDQTKEFSENDMIKVAQKAAPLKITNVAACLLSGNEMAIEPLSKLIDHALITLQLLDDWNDWREDQQKGNCTYFLSLVLKYCGLNNLAELNESHIIKAIYEGNLYQNIVAMVEKNHEFLKSFSELPVSYLISYHEIFLKACKQILDEIHKEKEVMLQGGFAYWLYQQKNCNDYNYLYFQDPHDRTR
jgi:hypothetical protein